MLLNVGVYRASDDKCDAEPKFRYGFPPLTSAI